jgi:hypothetical protein
METVEVYFLADLAVNKTSTPEGLRIGACGCDEKSSEASTCDRKIMKSAYDASDYSGFATGSVWCDVRFFFCFFI